jgi:HD superfamily phosphodiesterase
MITQKARKIYESLPVNKYPHVKRVIYFTKVISKKLKLSKKEIKLMEIIALLHDIGYKKQFKLKEKGNHAKYSCEMIKGIIKGTKFNSNEIKFMQDTIKTHSKFNKCKTKFQKILFDADKLDKTTFGEIIRKSMIFHEKYKTDDLEIFKALKQKIEKRKFHFKISNKIAQKNKKLLDKVFKEHDNFLERVEKSEKTLKFR